MGVVDDNAAAEDVPQPPPVSPIIKQNLSSRTRDALDLAFPFGRSAGSSRDIGQQRFKFGLPLASGSVDGHGLPDRWLRGPFHGLAAFLNAVLLRLVGDYIGFFDG